MTEGVETEKQYVERLQQYLRENSVAVSVKAVGVGRDPVRVVRKCLELRQDFARKGKPFDEYVCLVDFDAHATLEEAVRIARAEGIQLVVSRLKFEVWLLWHVTDSRAEMTSKQLDGLMTQHRLLERGKHLSIRFPIEKVDEAVRLARLADPGSAVCRVGPDPSSAMPELVAMMTGRRPSVD